VLFGWLDFGGFSLRFRVRFPLVGNHYGSGGGDFSKHESTDFFVLFGWLDFGGFSLRFRVRFPLVGRESL